MSLLFHAKPIHFNSKCVTLPEWVSLLTLCLAPLIAHIAFGTPSVSYLVHNYPKWYDHLCHYNPTSIMWRYAAITDRRIRSVCWNSLDFAASNAIFWTAKGWDGEEDIVLAAAPYCLRCPEQTRVRIFSTTMLKTIIATLQGISSLYWLIGPLARLNIKHVFESQGVDMVFFPFSILGLLRLCAATWLTDDFIYAPHNDCHGKKIPQNPQNLTIYENDTQRIDSPDGSLSLAIPHRSNDQFKEPNSSWESLLFRGFYLLTLGGLWGLSLGYVIRGGLDTTTTAKINGPTPTITLFLVRTFYFIFTTITVAIYAYYFYRGQTTSTIIPCISRTWYRVYTLLVMGFMSALIVVASIETNKRPDGIYTSKSLPGGLKCNDFQGWLPFTSNGVFSRIASKANILTWERASIMGVSVNEPLLGERYWLYNFTGYCVGRVD